MVLGADYDNKEAESTLLNLYKDNLPKGYLHNEGKMVPSRYWSVGNIAIRAGDLDWAYWFINSYKNEIVGDNETQDIYRLSLANYYFAIKDFEKCLENVPPSSPYSDFLITGKQLEIKCYYELMSDLLHYKLDSFKVFLSRTSSKLLSEHQKQINVDFVNFMTQIVATRPGDIKRAEKILNRLDVKKLAGNRRWLVEKAQELKNAKP